MRWDTVQTVLGRRRLVRELLQTNSVRAAANLKRTDADWRRKQDKRYRHESRYMPGVQEADRDGQSQPYREARPYRD